MECKGSISHCSHLNKKLGQIYRATGGQSLKDLKRIKAVDAEMLKRFREANNRDEIEAKRSKNGRNKTVVEEEEEAEAVDDDLDEWV